VLVVCVVLFTVDPKSFRITSPTTPAFACHLRTCLRSCCLFYCLSSVFQFIIPSVPILIQAENVSVPPAEFAAHFLLFLPNLKFIQHLKENIFYSKNFIMISTSSHHTYTPSSSEPQRKYFLSSKVSKNFQAIKDSNLLYLWKKSFWYYPVFI